MIWLETREDQILCFSWGHRTTLAVRGVLPCPVRQLIGVCSLHCSPLEMLTRLFSASFDVLIGAIR